VEGVFDYGEAASAVDYIIYSGTDAATAPISVSVLVLKDGPGDNTFWWCELWLRYRRNVDKAIRREKHEKETFSAGADAPNILRSFCFRSPLIYGPFRK
jgi:hypothetical protein